MKIPVRMMGGVGGDIESSFVDSIFDGGSMRGGGGAMVGLMNHLTR